jgi:hypothetical protein
MYICENTACVGCQFVRVEMSIRPLNFFNPAITELAIAFVLEPFSSVPVNEKRVLMKFFT